MLTPSLRIDGEFSDDQDSEDSESDENVDAGRSENR